MKIAMVFDGLGIGGIEKVGATYAKILLELGHEVSIINVDPRACEMKSLFPNQCSVTHDFLADKCLPDSFLPMVRRWRWGKYAYPAVYAISSILMKASLARRRMANSKDKFDIAIAFSGHIRDLTYVRYGFVDATYKMAWLHGSLSDYMLLSYAFGDLYRGIRNLCVLSTEGQDYVFQVCRFLEDELSVSHLANPVDDLGVVNEDVARRLSEEYGPYLLMVGRFDQDKDQKTVIRALRILFDKYPERCKLLFVGDGPTQEECKVLASNLELDDCVVFEGARMDVVNYYSSAAVLVHSSPSEGLPTVVLEGLAAGVPVVATRSLPGVPAILGADEYGLTCQVGNPEDLAEKIHAMLASNDLRERYRCAGLKRVQEYSREAVSQKLAIVLQNLIESN